MYEYNATVLEVHDGDTMHLDIDFGATLRQKWVIRLFGLNAPELVTPAGKVAKQFVLDWLATRGPNVIIHTEKDKREKYGRYLGTIFSLAGESLNLALLNSGNAVVYLP